MIRSTIWIVVALSLAACAPTTKEAGGVLLILGDNIGLFSWDANGQPTFVVPDTGESVREVEALEAQVGDCVGVLYDATFVVGSKAKPYKSLIGGPDVLKVPLVAIRNARLSRRPPEQLRKWLNAAHVSSQGICRAGVDGRPTAMADTYVTGSPAKAE